MSYRALLLPLFLFLVAVPAHAAPQRLEAIHQTQQLDSLQQRARALQLAESAQWHALLHYQRGWGGSRASQIDDSRFFLSPDGARNPDRELHETLRQLLDGEHTPRGGPVQCDLPARTRWLIEQLGIPETSINRNHPRCREHEQWMQGLAADGITLVFSDSFLNNPASMFGHTFLRIDSPESRHDPMLSYAANFAADTRGDPGLLFALNGVFGGYRGYFSVAPYYKKIAQYNDRENRDLWELSLAFNADERRRLIEHLWELLGVAINYYYFDENCSFHLLSLLDAARPELRLSEQFHGWVIPTETMRAITSRAGLVSATSYRPAPLTELRAHIATMSSQQIALTKALGELRMPPSDPPLNQLTSEERALVLERGFEFLSYRALRKRLPREQVAGPLHALLTARSALPVTSEPPLPVPATRPDQGHRSARISLGVGLRSDDALTTVGIRPAFHDLSDPTAGFLQGAAITVADTELRANEGDGVSLERFSLLEILSLSPADALISPLSWHLQLGTTREYRSDERGAASYGYGSGVTIGVGKARRLTPAALAFSLVEVAARYSTAADHHGNLGFGTLSGISWDAHESRSYQLQLAAHRFGPEGSYTTVSGGGSLRQQLTQQDTIALSARYRREFHESAPEVMVEWRRYF